VGGVAASVSAGALVAVTVCYAGANVGNGPGCAVCRCSGCHSPPGRVVTMTNPWIPVVPLDGEAFASVRRRAIFDCHKWDPQIGDVCAIAPHPLIIKRDAWHEVCAIAEHLAVETLAAEAELVQRPDLHARLGVPLPVRHALRAFPSRSEEGWRISEVNCDVPGGERITCNSCRSRSTYGRHRRPAW
jgi:hypothetical protein